MMRTTCRAIKAAAKASKPEAAVAAVDRVPASQTEDAGEGWEYEYVPHPDFPDLPSSVPLTFTLTMHACLSLTPSERPSFQQARPPPPN